MATLVLTAVGTYFGGPIGGAIGAIAGQQIDQIVFAPKPRQGPRLGDLSIQTSSYGTQIPKLFGRVRVAGTVVWATDLREDRTTRSNGKGAPKTETYSYSASFAVLLSARAIAGVGRIWADGKLLRGAAGDLKVETGYRLHLGQEDQALDPLIASAEGVGSTPGYRGCAYAVFENMALGEYGNRIPSLSFEVIADEAPVAAGALLVDLAGGEARSDGGPLLPGFAAKGDSVRSVAEVVGQALPFSCRDETGRATLQFAAGPESRVAADDLGARTGEDDVPRFAIERGAAGAVPQVLTLAHYDPARDYQQGTQRARREGEGRRELRLELPATIEAGAARTLAEQRLARSWTERTRASVTLPWSSITLRPGDRLQVEGATWRVTETVFERMVLRATLVKTVTAAPLDLPGAVGRRLAQPDLLHGRTSLAVLDLPAIDDAPVIAPQVAVFAAGVSPAWRRAALLASSDGGASFQPIGATAAPAIMGTAATILRPGASAVTDRVNEVEVRLLNEAMLLGDADAARLLTGVNAAMLGDELIQFGRAVPLGRGRYQLSELLRGRRGTEHAIGRHRVGEVFVLVERDSFASVPAGLAVAGVSVTAAGIGDYEPLPVARLDGVGLAVRPLSPVRIVATYRSNGDIEVGWTRRSRDGWSWSDGVDAPLGEERERYVVEAAAGDATRRDEVDEPRWIYPEPARREAFARGVAVITITVAQIGSFGVSLPAHLIVEL